MLKSLKKRERESLMILWGKKIENKGMFWIDINLINFISIYQRTCIYVHGRHIKNTLWFLAFDLCADQHKKDSVICVILNCEWLWIALFCSVGGVFVCLFVCLCDCLFYEIFQSAHLNSQNVFIFRSVIFIASWQTHVNFSFKYLSLNI